MINYIWIFMPEWIHYLALRKKQLIYIGFFSVFINLCMLVLPIYSLQVFSRVLSSRSIETLILLATLSIALLFFQGLLEFIRTRLLHVSSAQFDSLCSEKVVINALANSGQDPKLARQTLQDLVQARIALSSPVISLLCDLPWTPIFILVIFSLHPLLGWFAFAATIMLTILTIVNLRLTQKNQDQLIKKSFDNDNYLQKLVEHGDAIELFDTAKPLAERWYEKNIEMVGIQYKASLQMHLLQGVIKYARMLLQIGVIGLGAWLVVENETVPGVMLASSILLGRVLAPLDQGINLWKPWRQSRAGLLRVKEILDVVQVENRIEMPIESVLLSVSKLSLRDKFQKVILNNVQFELKPNNALAIIGSSGSGKSSLLNLLAGHHKIQQGDVRINGINIAELLPSQRNQLIGYLPQKTELFEATVLENICSFDDGDDVENKVFTATNLVGIHQFISKLPNAYNTIIGRDGVQLSGGEMQLIALARALYHQPKLLLLDEPDSNLDMQSEQVLLNVIQKLKQQGVSIIFVTHRTRILQVVDWVLVLNKGIVEDAGRKADVLQRINEKNKQNIQQAATNE